MKDEANWGKDFIDFIMKHTSNEPINLQLNTTKKEKKSQIEFKIKCASPDDAAVICNARNSGDRLYLKNAQLMSVEQTKKWLENLPSSSQRFIVLTDGSELNGYGYLNRADYYIGIIRIDNIDYINKNADVGLDIFDKYKGQGLAVPIYKWLLNYMFNDLGFNALSLDVLNTNKRAIHIYEKIGFRIYGCKPNWIWRDGKYVDSVTMVLLRKWWINE